MTDPAQGENWYAEETATFGDRLAGAREHAGLTVEQMAAQVGVRIETAQAWEDDIKEPRANRLQMLAGMLNVSLSWLLTGRGDGPTEPVDGQEVDSDILGLLAEIRALRSQIVLSAERLGQIEKRLRKALKA